MEIQSERGLLEVRSKLKKFRLLPPQKVLLLLKCVRECTLIQKDWIRKTKITKTLMRIAYHKYSQEDDVKNMVIKLSKYLIQKFKLFFPHLKIDYSEINKQKQAGLASQDSKIIQENTEKKENMLKPAESDTINNEDDQNNSNLPVFENTRRNQGLQGFLKYIQKGLEENMMKVSVEVAVAIEKYLNDKNTQDGIFKESGYKEGVKKICTLFLDKEKGSELKSLIFKEYNTKQQDQFQCLSDALH